MLAGKLEAKRSNCAPVAGKSTLNRLEHTPRHDAGKYHKIDYHAPSLEALFVDIFLDAHKRPPKEIVLDLDPTDDPIHGEQEGRFFHGYYDCYCYLPLYIFCGRFLLAAKDSTRNNRIARAVTTSRTDRADRLQLTLLFRVES